MACLLTRERGSGAVCCHLGAAVLSGGGFGMTGDWSHDEFELDGANRGSGALAFRGGGRPPPSSMSASSVTSGADGFSRRPRPSAAALLSACSRSAASLIHFG